MLEPSTGDRCPLIGRGSLEKSWKMKSRGRDSLPEMGSEMGLIWIDDFTMGSSCFFEHEWGISSTNEQTWGWLIYSTEYCSLCLMVRMDPQNVRVCYSSRITKWGSIILSHIQRTKMASIAEDSSYRIISLDWVWIHTHLDMAQNYWSPFWDGSIVRRSNFVAPKWCAQKKLPPQLGSTDRGPHQFFHRWFIKQLSIG